jgi:hypothetical protein
MCCQTLFIHVLSVPLYEITQGPSIGHSKDERNLTCTTGIQVDVRCDDRKILDDRDYGIDTRFRRLDWGHYERMMGFLQNNRTSGMPKKNASKTERSHPSHPHRHLQSMTIRRVGQGERLDRQRGAQRSRRL